MATAPATPDLATASDTGISTTDNKTNDTTPTFTGTGLTAGYKVQVFKDLNDDGILDSGELLGSATVAAGGTWSVTPATAMTAGTYNIKANVVDKAGNVSEASEALSLTLDTIAAAPTTLDLVAGSDSGTNTTDNITNDTTPTITGVAEAGATVKLYEGTTVRGTTVADATTGEWSITSSALTSQGVHSLTAKQTDIAGNTSPASAILAVTLDSVALAPTALDLATLSDLGTSSTDNLTSDTTPTITGKAEAGAVVELFDGSTSLGTTTADNLGAWSFTSLDLDDGAHVLTAKQTDKAGNLSPASTALTVTIDNHEDAPAAPDLTAASDTGASNTDDITTDTTPTFTGSGLHVGDKVQVFKDIDNDGIIDTGELLGTATVAAGGTWSLTPATTMSAGDYSIKAIVTDTAGNISKASEGLDLTILGLEDTPPGLTSATINGTVLTLTFDEIMDGTHQPSTSYFQVTAGTNKMSYPVSDIAINGNTVMLTLVKPVSSSDAVTVKYADPTTGNDAYALQDRSGNDAASIGSTTAYAVTNQTAEGADTVFRFGTLKITEGTNAAFTFTFSKNIKGVAAAGWTLLLNGTTPMTINSATSTISGNTLTLHTSNTFSPTDYVKITYTGTGFTDMYDNPFLMNGYDAYILGGSGANTMNLEQMAGYDTEKWNVNSYFGNDILTGGYKKDTLSGSSGADTIYGAGSNNGSDNIYLTDGNIRATDTVVIKLDDLNDGAPKIFDFDVSNAGGTNNDRLDLPSNTIAADTTTLIKGIDVGALAQHSINKGIITFYNSTGMAISIRDGVNTEDALAYMAKNITTPGTTVAVAYDSDGNGNNDSLAVFQQGGGDEVDDILATLVGVNGVTLGTTAGQNVVQIVDSQQPFVSSASLTTGANAALVMNFTEKITATSGAGWTLLKNGTTAMSVTGISGSGSNTLTLQTSTTLAATDYVLISYNSATGNIVDASNNKAEDILPGVAIGGSADTVINLTGKSGAYTLYDPNGGNDTLTGTADDNFIIGGLGADILNGGEGSDEYKFFQGDSPIVTLNAGADGILNTGDTFNFVSGMADIISGGFDVASEEGDRIWLQAEGGTPLHNALTDNGENPVNGKVGDQQYFLTRGNYASGVFTVNTTSGLDTLVVYDGDPAEGGYDISGQPDGTGISQTGLVVSGITPQQLEDREDGSIGLVINPNADTTAPTLQAATIDGDLVTLTYSEAMDGAHQPSSSYFQVMTTNNGNTNGYTIASLAVNGDKVYLKLFKPVSASEMVTIKYIDPTADNNAYALQDSAGNDAAGLVNMTVTNLTAETTDTPFKFGLLKFSETTNATFTFIFTKGIEAANAMTGWTLLKNGTTPITITGATITNGSILTLTTSATLSATDFVKISYAGGTLKDNFNNAFTGGGYAAMFLGGSGINSLDLSQLANNSSSPWWANGGSGNDTLVGGYNGEILAGGPGADTIIGGGGNDTIALTEGSRVTDTVVIDNGTVYSAEMICDFDVSNVNGTNNDQINLPSNTIAADTNGVVDGIDSGVYAKHSITNGIITFYDVNGVQLLFDSTVDYKIQDYAMKYLINNITMPGATVAYAVDSDGNGYADSLGLFQDDGAWDIIEGLGGVNGVTLGTTPGQNVVQLVDTTMPEINDIKFSAHSIFLEFSEKVTYISNATHNSILLNGSTSLSLTNPVIADNVLTLTVTQTLLNTDWLLLTTGADIKDASGNATVSGQRGAIGGSGNNTINMSSFTGNFYIGGRAGNDTLTASNQSCELDGGAGTDILIGGAADDNFRFSQEEGTAVLFIDTNNNNLLESGETFTFTGGADEVRGFSGGDSIHFSTPDNFSQSVHVMDNTPADGLVIDQRYFLVGGSLSGSTFTIGGGSDTLVVYDGDPTGDVSQAALVIKNVIPTSVNTNNWNNISLV